MIHDWILKILSYSLAGVGVAIAVYGFSLMVEAYRDRRKLGGWFVPMILAWLMSILGFVAFAAAIDFLASICFNC